MKEERRKLRIVATLFISILFSTDIFGQWQQVITGYGLTGGNAIDASSKNCVVIAVAYGGSSGLLITIDGGKSWKSISPAAVTSEGIIDVDIKTINLFYVQQRGVNYYIVRMRGKAGKLLIQIRTKPTL